MRFSIPSSLRRLSSVVNPTGFRWTIYAALSALLSLATWQLLVTVGEKSGSILQQRPPQSPNHPQVIHRASGEEIAMRHLFGTAVPAASTATPVIAASAVHVIGIIAGDDAKESWAILDINGSQHLYQVGSTLPDGE